jgi:hypothetical protein
MQVSCSRKILLKGTVSRDFFHLVFFMNTFPPASQSIPLGPFQIFSKIAEIFTSQGAPLVSTTPVANFATCFASVVDTGGKFATSVNDTVENNGNNIRLLRP